MVQLSQQVLADAFPNEHIFPNLLELESKAALVMSAGSPFLGDGLRPVMPNNLLVGMMNCKPKSIGARNNNVSLPKRLQVYKL